MLVSMARAVIAMSVLMARAVTITISVSIAKAVTIAMNVGFDGQDGHDSHECRFRWPGRLQ